MRMTNYLGAMSLAFATVFPAVAQAGGSAYEYVDVIEAGCDPITELAAAVSFTDMAATVVRAQAQAPAEQVFVKNRRGRKVAVEAAPAAQDDGPGTAALVTVNLTVCFSPFEMRTVSGDWALHAADGASDMQAGGAIFDEGVTLIYQALGVPGRSSSISLALLLEDVATQSGATISTRVTLGPDRSS